MASEARTYQAAIPQDEAHYANVTVSAEAFREARDFEDVAYCSHCEEPFATDGEVNCFKCRGHKHAARFDYTA